MFIDGRSDKLAAFFLAMYTAVEKSLSIIGSLRYIAIIISNRTYKLFVTRPAKTGHVGR